MQDRVSLERISRLPNPSWELPRDELYVQLGCRVCPHAICFKAKGVSSKVPEISRSPEDAKDLADIRKEVDKQSDTMEGNSWVWDEACDEPCPQAEEMEIAVDLLNDRFGSDLTLPQA